MKKNVIGEKAKTGHTFKTVFTVLKYFFPAAWRYKKSYFFLSIIKAVLETLQPFIAIFCMPLLIDEMIGGRSVQKLLTYAIILVVGEGLCGTLTSVISINLEKYATRFGNFFTMQMSQRVMELDFQLTEDKNALDQIEKARTGMSWYSGGVHGITSQFFNIISNALRIVGVLIILLMNAPILLLVTAVLLVIKTYYNNKNNKIEIESYSNLSKTNRVFGYVLWQLADFQYGKDIRLYGAEKMMHDKGSEITDELCGIWSGNAKKQLPNNMKQIVLDVVRDFCNYFYLGFIVITGRITIGIFTQLLSACSTFQGALQGVIWGVQEIVKKSNYAYEYVKFMDYPTAMIKGEKSVEMDEHTIEFSHVSFTYPNTDVKVLDDVSITLKAGEKLSVVGLNGAGKTTFIKLLCRLYDVTSGEILLDGVNIKDYDYEEYLKIFSVVFQDFKLFAFSIKENITLENDSGKAENTAYMAGLEDKIQSLPNGIDTMIFKQFDENGIEPSGGEQQKIAIARALYKQSPIVILDEPTAALDPVAEYEIYRQFDTLVGGKTAVYISHRLSSCKFCDRIAVFCDGTVKELGTHDELVIIPNGIYAEMFAAQAQYYN